MEHTELRLIRNEIVIDGIPKEKTKPVSIWSNKWVSVLISSYLIVRFMTVIELDKKSKSKTKKIFYAFSNRETMNNFLKAKKVIRDLSTKNIGLEQESPKYVRENLTTYSNKLFKLARDFNYNFVWTANGRVFVGKSDNTIIINEHILRTLKVSPVNLN